MTNNGLTRAGRIFTLTGGMAWLDTTKRMLVRTCWTDMASILSGKSHGVVKGKAGRGKSMFLLFLVFEILLCARSGSASEFIENLKPPPNVVIMYIDRSSNKYRVTTQGIENYNGKAAGVTYCFSDNVDVSDANVGSALTLAVTSGDADVLKEFSKRLQGVGEEQATLYMPSLTVKEMAQVFPTLSQQEVQFKFDIVGGNPRRYQSASLAAPSSKYGRVVADVLSWMFGPSYVPPASPSAIPTVAPTTVPTAQPSAVPSTIPSALPSAAPTAINSDQPTAEQKRKLGRWAIDLVVGALDAAVESRSILPGPAIDSSLFREYIVRADYSKEREDFSSMFLAIVACKLKKEFEADVMGSLKNLFGSSGMGNAFEYTSHIVLANTNAEQICWTSRGRYCKVALGNRRKVLIRNVADIAELKVGDRGVPTTCNFPFIDEVIPPNLGVQFTTGCTHDVPNTSAPQIIEALGLKNEADFTVVFVVPQDVLPLFRFPTNLGAIKMCVTVPEAITETAFKALRNKKRKHSS